MKRSKRILQLKTLVDQDAEREAIKLAKMQTQLLGEKDKITQLVSFKDDYLHRSTPVGGRVFPAALQDVEKFAKQLTFSIGQQEKYITVLAQHIEAQREIWHKLNNKVKAYERWIEKIRIEEQVIEMRNEQKMLDEFVINQRNKSES
ncbi:MAG: flagellar export protein FliJ [Pseudomonadales bacterium]|nr:flagellar export protein FliJ [Pseudomonadales bacterium]